GVEGGWGLLPRKGPISYISGIAEKGSVKLTPCARKTFHTNGNKLHFLKGLLKAQQTFCKHGYETYRFSTLLTSYWFIIAHFLSLEVLDTSLFKS
ncbi:MAG: hypothetical protein OEZ25_08755, partial [Candidatus Bathyarchaeota archaeon]|nr:hypothetical protein [Candidatus Bathyarchaeota archaeon]